ncbi:hypothetical protein ABW21_db0208685 [Orbilia brochopaga]|nr:hypothetical protein ABW21_db0208685 [Drechslerella brochopaga]
MFRFTPITIRSVAHAETETAVDNARLRFITRPTNSTWTQYNARPNSPALKIMYKPLAIVDLKVSRDGRAILMKANPSEVVVENPVDSSTTSPTSESHAIFQGI